MTSNDLITSAPAYGRREKLARIGFWSGAAYALLLLVIHFARPDVSIVWQTTSEYARGPGGWAMVVAFLLSAVGLLALALAASRLLRSVLGRIGVVTLVVAAAGAVLGGVFVTDPIETSQAAMSVSGTVHGLGAGLALMLTPIAALIINIGISRRTDSKKIKTLALILAPLPSAALVMFMVVQAVLLPADGQFGPDVAIGPAERVLVAAFAAWQIATSAMLGRTGGWLSRPAKRDR